MRPQDLKHLGYGVVIGAAMAGVFLAGFFSFPRMGISFGITPTHTISTSTPAPTLTHTALPTSTFTLTPSPLPSATHPPTRTATHTSTDLLIAEGEILIAGPLTREQQIRLYEASLAYISLTVEQSKQTSALINLSPFTDASTVCGPLSIAILQRADLLPPDLMPHDFFLLDPDLPRDRGLLQSALPGDIYGSVRYRTRLNKVIWSDQPLFAGDFIYTYAGSAGNFEHMLVVNRVDYRGRAYSVTNYNTPDGYLINEVMLYDPVDPTTGIFAQWAKQEKQLLGSTGFDGFEVWRLKQ
jgi:hypothetical protein